MEQEIKQRWRKKRESVYNLKQNLDKLKRKVFSDLSSSNEKAKLTACIIRIMFKTSERVGNEESATNGHFGITEFKPKHIKIKDNQIYLKYKGKSGVIHEKDFYDPTVAKILKELLSRKNPKIFTSEDGFEIKADKVNRYLKHFDCKSKDIRGFNSNSYMISELKRIGKVDEVKDRPKIFNQLLKKVASKISHTPATLKNQYLLPEIQRSFYSSGKVKTINL